ncbi:phosphoribosylglycinamide formyltransferase [Thermoleophilum album]|uniref:Phosphoribosylglycinamide formyltransferase n=1 Tax=Thermoleophilum album TaxID=29539 RepID=A0A1H6FLW3_THEAL|nr:phosphoribosylglycinamide formyltransferase [Thermoleophilum album]SEH10794.1 phosphoribosylglycinamide formyltransferase-1 [Thermoleophilum album]
MAFRIAVLVSGRGSNLQALIDQVHGREGIEIVAVASSRPAVPALARAERAGIETAVFAADDYPTRRDRDRALGDWLERRAVDLIVLAGFMEILSGAFVERFRWRIVNVHPALLPSFPGTRAIEQALAYGVKVTGVTVHFVDEGVDTGPIILQEAVEVPYSRDVSELERRIHAVEHRLLPEAVRLIAAGAVRRDERDPRVVHVERNRN